MCNSSIRTPLQSGFCKMFGHSIRLLYKRKMKVPPQNRQVPTLMHDLDTSVRTCSHIQKTGCSVHSMSKDEFTEWLICLSINNKTLQSLYQFDCCLWEHISLFFYPLFHDTVLFSAHLFPVVSNKWRHIPVTHKQNSVSHLTLIKWK